MKLSKHFKLIMTGAFSLASVGLFAPIVLGQGQRVYAGTSSTVSTVVNGSDEQDFHLTNQHSNLDTDNHVLGGGQAGPALRTKRSIMSNGLQANSIQTYSQTVMSFTIGDSRVPRVDTVDVASYQNGMTQANYNSLRASGVKAVIVKSSEGSTYRNPYAAKQLAQAKAAGLKTAVYHYVHFANQSDAIAEANYFANTLDSLGFSKTSPVVADIEDSDVGGDVAANVNAFWNVLSTRGYVNHIVYTGLYYSYSKAAISTVGNERAWVAQYPYVPSVDNLLNTGYGAWQFSSMAGIPNYNGRVDVSIDYQGIFTSEFSFDHITDSHSLSGVKQIDETNRADGIYSAPFNTVAGATTENHDGVNYNGDMVQLIQQATTKRSTYVQVKASNGQIFWIDQAALKDPKSDPILAKTTENYFASINQTNRADGIYSGGPYRTTPSAYVANSDAPKYKDQLVHVLATERTGWSTFAEVQFSNGSIYWIDTQALKRSGFTSIIASQTISYEGIIDETGRNDGVYHDGPYQTSAATFLMNYDGPKYNNRSVTVLKTAKTAWSTYANVKLDDGTTFWIDTAAIKKVVLYPTLSQETVDYNAVIDETNRKDGVYLTGPYRSNVSEYSENSNGPKYNGKAVHVTAQATNKWSTYVLVTTADGTRFWIDKAAIKPISLYPILSSSDQSYTATINQSTRSDGIYASGPYSTSLATYGINYDAKKYNGQTVQVLKEARTSWSTYVLVKTASGAQFWIDKLGIQSSYSPTLSQSNVNYDVLIDENGRADGIYYAGPYNSNAATSVQNSIGPKYNGQAGHASVEATNKWSTYVKVTLTDGTSFWIDKAAIKSLPTDPVLSRRSVHYTATINQNNRADGVYTTGPYRTSYQTYTINYDAKKYDGQQGTVMQEVQTSWSTYVQIKLGSGATIWLDKAGVRAS